MNIPYPVHEKSFSAWVPLLLIIYNVTANLANDIYLPSMPKLVEVFSTTSSILQLTMTAWFAGIACPQLILGPLADRFGRRPILFGGGICFIVATLLAALAPNIKVLITGRFFQGIGVCSLNIITFSILSDLYSHKKRVIIMNYISICGSLSPLLGPIIGGYILSLYGWQMNFFLIFSLALISIICLWYKLPESNRQPNLYALHFNFLYKNYFSLIRNKYFLKHLIPYCLLIGGLIAYLTVAPFLIINKLKIPPHYFGYTQIPIFCASIVGSSYVNYFTHKYYLSTKKLVIAGLVIVTISTFLLLATSYALGNRLYILITFMSFYGLGFSLCGGILVSKMMAMSKLVIGSSAAILGFVAAMSCVVLSSLFSVTYNGTILCAAIGLSFTAQLALFSFLSLESGTETLEEENNGR